MTKKVLLFTWACTVAVVFSLAAMGVVFNGCSTLQGQGFGIKAPDPFTEDPSCTIYKDMGVTSGTIHEFIKNPCAAQNIVVSMAKTGVALEQYQVEDLKKWATTAKDYIQVGLTFSDVKLFIGSEIAKLNHEIGMVYFIFSDLLLELPDANVLNADDVKLVDASIDDIVAKVERISKLIGG